MANITAALVKELRDRTGLGMMECKKALAETDGDIEVAIDNLPNLARLKLLKKQVTLLLKAQFWLQTVLMVKHVYY